MKKYNLTINIIILLLIILTASIKKAAACPKVATIEKIKGLKTRILEKPLDKQKLKLGTNEFILMINKKNQLIIDNKGRQQVLANISHGKEQPSYYIEIDWVGDNNNDCKVDMVLWKKLGLYLGKYEKDSKLHEEAPDEKIYIESQNSKTQPYKIQSLGKY